MKIDWKYVCTTSGYCSLKSIYKEKTDEATKGQRSTRAKKEYYKHFMWVISRAKHYADFENTTIDIILNRWEEGRDYCWLNYYQKSRFPKRHSNSLKKT